MTCKEQYIKDHPILSEEALEGVMRNMCPHDYGYLDEAYWCNGRNDDNCKKCWNREIPEDEKKPVEFKPLVTDKIKDDVCRGCTHYGGTFGNNTKFCRERPYNPVVGNVIFCERYASDEESESKKFKEAGEAFKKSVAEGLEGASAAAKAFVERFNEAAAKMNKYSGAMSRVEAADEETAIRYTGAVKNIRELEELGLKDISSESVSQSGKVTVKPGDTVKVSASDSSSSTTRTGMIKDSGARIQFATGAVTDSHDGKGRCDLMPLDVVAGFRGQILNDIYDYQTSGDPKYLKIALQKFIDKHMKDMSTALLEVSIHFEEGAKKYGEHNWQKGIPTHRHIDSAVRHYLKYMRGDHDEPHDRAFMWRLLCCIWTCIHKPELNDYSKENKEVKES